jgi:hypothetical protein
MESTAPSTVPDAPTPGVCGCGFHPSVRMIATSPVNCCDNEASPIRDSWAWPPNDARSAARRQVSRGAAAECGGRPTQRRPGCNGTRRPVSRGDAAGGLRSVRHATALSALRWAPAQGRLRRRRHSAPRRVTASGGGIRAYAVEPRHCHGRDGARQVLECALEAGLGRTRSARRPPPMPSEQVEPMRPLTSSRLGRWRPREPDRPTDSSTRSAAAGARCGRSGADGCRRPH